MKSLVRSPARFIVLGSFVIGAIACGHGPDAASPSAASSSSSAAPPALAASEAAAPSAESPAEPPKRRKPFDVYNACMEVVTLAFGEDPGKSGDAARRTMAPSSSIEGARNPDGNQTVWLLDAKGEPLVKVNVTRGMKRVEIGRSCRTLDAR